ncbi:hypothetical protein A2973_05270 [Candidatus Gottesmanbacteria bacterium RIFCSPLOWO2_01_FULL_49_10]|uniref:Uncharacterized protein n=1 Tax=Candidatus Gottesmanbacteria bacterium RIFCSPLOWO2_01_FULL_49_10 TaxID=1798396 RepID=A0A1F6B0E7_9BACT|nr:MAG: hypothetical protein A2973_05270 [Candidatus Gottesmanbacteria bacterium RIFCSPLOWO2_01_FULL_49_10]
MRKFMSMAKRKQHTLPKWITIAIAVALLLTIVVLFKIKTQQSPRLESGYQTYQDPTYGLTIQYPGEWEIRKDTQVFENGDAIAFGISGPTQKKNTELTDGAQVAIAKPFTIKTDLPTWIKEYFPPQATLSKMTLTQQPFESVENCSRLGCMTYYFTVVNNQVNGAAIFTEGPDKDKMVYENATLYMLKSLRFTDTKNGGVSKEEAITKVKTLPDVIDYLKRVPQGVVAINGEEDDTFLIQVYEFKNGHTATYNWYSIDKATGVVEKQF